LEKVSADSLDESAECPGTRPFAKSIYGIEEFIALFAQRIDFLNGLLCLVGRNPIRLQFLDLGPVAFLRFGEFLVISALMLGSSILEPITITLG
jgi:hypothetical protein